MDVIDELAIVRKEKKIRQEDLAKEIGITREALSYFESHQKEPSYKRLRLWCEALGVKLTIINRIFQPKDFV